MPTFTPGKSLLTIVNLITMLGPYAADWKYAFPFPSSLQHISNVKQNKFDHRNTMHLLISY
jgi:hypothetical protein